MLGIDNIQNKEKVAIIVVGYNRLNSVIRLLNSLLEANYTVKDIPLVISIDCSGDHDLYAYVRSFEWPYGDKYVNIENERLGLLKHITKCGRFTSFFKAIILLEDDLYVSPHFYSYVMQMLQMYSTDERIAEISLYKNERNGYVGLPFENEQNGCDVFLMQDVSTWGECWTEKMWQGYEKWMNEHTENDVLSIDMPEIIKKWERAWSKYYNAYVVESGKYVLYPNVSLTTNFSDAGEHGGDNHSVVQVNLLQRDCTYRLAPFDKLVKYDIYFNNDQLVEWLNIPMEDLCLDIYGFLRKTKKRYILSTRTLPYRIIKSFALNMRPIELNVKYNIKGKGLYLYDTSESGKGDNSYTKEVVPYFLEGFSPFLLVRYVLKSLFKQILTKLKITNGKH